MNARFIRILNVIAPFLGLAVVIGLFSIKPEVREAFLTVSNFKLIVTQTVIVGIGALGMTLIIISAGIDLSVGSVVALTSVLGAVVLKNGHAPALAIAACVLAGGLLGLINGTFVSALRITPFIVTLGMMGIARGSAKWFADEQTVSIPATWIDDAMRPFPAWGETFPDWLQWTRVAPGVWLAVALVVAMIVVMRNTIFGRYVFAIGSNESTATLCGIRVWLMKPLIYTCAGLFFGLAGLMQLARLHQGDPTSAAGLELDIIAAVVVGGASLNGGSGSILGSIIGALIMAVLRNGSQQMGWPTYVQEIIIGCVIILAVTLDKFRHVRG